MSIALGNGILHVTNNHPVKYSVPINNSLGSSGNETIDIVGSFIMVETDLSH